VTDAEDITRAASALFGNHGVERAMRICDTQIDAAIRYGDLDGMARWKAIRAAVATLAPPTG